MQQHHLSIGGILMKNHFSIRALSILLGALISMSLSVSSTLAADNDTSRKPARLITMALEYPGIEIPAGDDISMDIILHNKGRSDEDVNVAITAKRTRSAVGTRGTGRQDTIDGRW